MRAFIRHMRAVKNPRLCRRGAKAWMAQRGWDWQDFVENGIDIETLRDTGDEFALRVVAEAEKENSDG